MTIVQYLPLAVSPVLIIFGVILMKNKFEMDSLKNIRNSILFGLAGVLLLFVASYLIELRWHGNLNNMRRKAFFVFVVTAFSAELGMFALLRMVLYNLPSFKGPIEGIIYSVFIGLGFSTFASPLFIYGIVGPAIPNMTAFLVIYPFANIVFAIVLGFFVGMGKLRKNTLIDQTTGLFLATFLHGMFYFSFITTDIRLFIVTIIGFLIVSVTLWIRAVQLFNKQEEDN